MIDANQGLSQHQQLRLKLNPKQMRFGRLLEMSSPEFEDEVRRMLDENPALQTVEGGVDMPGHPDDDNAHDDFNETAEQLQRADYASDDDVPSYRLRDSQSYTADRYEPVAADDAPTAAESLLRQLGDYDLDDTDREVAVYVIGNLDANGYLTRSVGDIVYDVAMGAGIDVGEDDVRRMIDMVRSLDPAGIGARDLRDCLLLQLDRMPVSVDVRTAREIVDKYFDLFSRKHFDRLAAALDIPEESLRDALDVIRSLNPKPASLLEPSGAGDRMGYITPDFNVEVDAAGVATVSLTGHVPELAIESSFAIDDNAPAPVGRRDAEARAFIRNRRDDAAEFISMTRRRGETLMAVMQAIVRLQPEFFATYDRARLRPMVLRDIRRLTGLDLSVISRATAGKYVMTPDGMFPLKMFFNEGLNDERGTSSHAVAEALRALIEGEDSRHPLTDAELCDRLVADGFDVARRTVAKYRERMGYPVARLRRNIK
ncbi:MAG: RNA polymerase factor sigma-54 [Bacteroidales bacterium]|nr:RNA polymerase factor sigma-54 [Bacteroidales bacterium]